MYIYEYILYKYIYADMFCELGSLKFQLISWDLEIESIWAVTTFHGMKHEMYVASYLYLSTLEILKKCTGDLAINTKHILYEQFP